MPSLADAVLRSGRGRYRRERQSRFGRLPCADRAGEFTVAATGKGARSFELVEKMNGKVVYRGTYTVSDDGKTMTAVFTPEGTNETVTAVYDRQ